MIDKRFIWKYFWIYSVVFKRMEDAGRIFPVYHYSKTLVYFTAMSISNKFASQLNTSTKLLAVVTIFTYVIYAAVFSLCTLPSIRIIAYAFNHFRPTDDFRFSNHFIFGFWIGMAVFTFYLSSVTCLGLIMRLSSIGLKPGRYSLKTFTVIRWMFHGGIYGMASVLVLPMIKVTVFINLFYRLVGCRMGKGVRINTSSLIDSYLLSIGDNVVIGGETLITCHIIEGDHLILRSVSIGNNTLIGARSYIPPGVSIGNNCVVGICSYIRKDTVIPDNTKLTSIAAIPLREARKVERGLDRFYQRMDKNCTAANPVEKNTNS